MWSNRGKNLDRSQAQADGGPSVDSDSSHPKIKDCSIKDFMVFRNGTALKHLELTCGITLNDGISSSVDIAKCTFHVFYKSRRENYKNVLKQQ